MSQAAAGHADQMDAVYRLTRHIYDLTRKYYLLGRDTMIRDLAPPPGGTVLEIGCGTARNLIVVAKRYPETMLYGLDISEAMLETARASVERAGLSNRIHLAQADATAFDPQTLFGRGNFDRVFMSYTLSMIPDWSAAIEQGATRLAPGGRLAAVDFGQQEALPKWWRATLFGWLDRFHVTPRRELPAVLKRIAQSNGLSLDFAPLFRGYAWSASLSRD